MISRLRELGLGLRDEEPKLSGCDERPSRKDRLFLRRDRAVMAKRGSRLLVVEGAGSGSNSKGE